jgi:ureidoglycolate lyase
MTPKSSLQTPKYLVVVALNSEQTDLPDLSTLKAFVAESNQGINYHCGTWHHPMVALPIGGDGDIDFVCMVHNGIGLNVNHEDDCQEFFLNAGEQIDINFTNL